MANFKKNLYRVVFDATKLESYRISQGLKARNVARLLQISYSYYRQLLVNSYAPASYLEVFKRMEEQYGIDLGLEIIKPMPQEEAKSYAKNKYKIPSRKSCRRCPWRRDLLCLTPLCLKMRDKYDVGFEWGGYLDIYRKLQNEENVI